MAEKMKLYKDALAGQSSDLDPYYSLPVAAPDGVIEH